MKLKIVVAAAVQLAALFASGMDFLLTKAPAKAEDWTDSGFYAGGSAPTGASTDRVFVHQNVAAISVSGTDATTLGFLGGISRLVLSNCVFTITVDDGVVDFYGAVDGASRHKSELKKEGSGTLNLKAYKKYSSSSSTYDYNIDIHVVAGTLRLPAADSNTYNNYELVTVDADAKLVTPIQASWQIRGLAGAGLVTNEAATKVGILDTPYFGSKEGIPTFSGVLAGNVELQIRKDAKQALTGTASTFTADVSMGYEGGELHILKIGDTKTDDSSIGHNDRGVSISGTGTRLVYEGSGETTHKKFYIYSTETTIDAGAAGGITFAGDFPLWTAITNSTYQRGLILDGSNTSECVVAGRFDPDGYSRVRNVTTWNIKKRGTGTWRFTADDHKLLDGLFSVENGVLAFDSMADRGKKCALGTASLTYPYGAAISPETATTYAYLLGDPSDASATGLMQYRGETATRCIDRPVALAGSGGFKSYAGAGRIVYSDVTSVGSGAYTLVLDGDGGVTSNYVCNVTNGAGVVSVRKEGGGGWTMGGMLDFSGSLEVNGGTLVISDPAEYRYYRFVIKEIGLNNPELAAQYASEWTGNTWGYVCWNEIGLYDSEGVRQNLDMATAANSRFLEPGETAWSTALPVIPDGDLRSLEYLFDDLAKVIPPSGSEIWNGMVMRFDDQIQPSRTDTNHWVVVDMRLPASANRICQYDVCSGNAAAGAYGGRLPSACALYGSVDGVDWELLGDEFDETVAHSSNNYQWLKANIAFDAGKERGGRKHSGGWMLKKTAPTSKNPLANVSSVSVANGATLRYEGGTPPTLSNLRVDMSQTGTIDGFAFAANGTVDLVDDSSSSAFAAVRFLNASGLDNVAAWSVSLNGVSKPAYRVQATEEGLRVVRPGCFIILR